MLARSRRLLFGRPGPAWGSDLTWNFATNQYWGPGAVSPTDTHAQSINAPYASGIYAPFAANVLTQTDVGLQTVPTAIQLLTSPRDFTNAAWVAVNVTKAFTATGIDGVANSASTLTATAGNGAVQQTLVAAASSRTFSVWIKRRTGTGTINISQDGVAWTDVTSQINSSTYTRVSLTASILNASVGIQIVTNGDAIDVDVGTLQAGSFATSPLYTTATTNGNMQVNSLAGRLGGGVAGLIQCDVKALSSAAFPILVGFNDGSAVNTMNIYANSGSLFAAMDSASVGQANVNLGAFTGGMVTVAFAFSSNFVTGRIVGSSAPSPDVLATLATVDRIAIGGSGFGVSQNNYQITKKLALRFGPQDATSFSAMFAKAQLAAVSP